jgi:peptidoglycan/xylan/chitin deacetylase (PgdA/CDA1 family)
MFTVKESFTQVVIPLIIFLLVAMFVVDLLLAGSDHEERVPQIITEAVYGEAKKPKPEELSLVWKPYYGGGAGIDQAITVNDSSLRISTGSREGWYGARSVLPETAKGPNSISFAYRFENWEDTSRVMLLISSGDDFTNYFGINLQNYFAEPPGGEWRQVVIDRSAFEVIEGAPRWDTITDIAVRVVPKPGIATRVWIDDIQFHTVQRNQPIITFTFDDGHDSVMDAKSIMSQYGMRGTAYVIPEFLGTEGYMKQLEIDELATSGWDISGHGKKNLLKLSSVEADADLAQTYLYLVEHDYQGRQHYAYPNGGYSQSTQSLALEYFESARTIDGFAQPPELLYRQNVNAVTISVGTPVEAIVAEIERAKQEGTWLILVWHDFSDQPEIDYEYHLDDFEWLVEYVAKEELEVLPYSEAYARVQENT